jgi:hypothetical protein
MPASGDSSVDGGSDNLIFTFVLWRGLVEDGNCVRMGLRTIFDGLGWSAAMRSNWTSTPY